VAERVFVVALPAAEFVLVEVQVPGGDAGIQVPVVDDDVVDAGWVGDGGGGGAGGGVGDCDDAGLVLGK